MDSLVERMRLPLVAAVVLLAAALAVPTQAGGPSRPAIVVELFTSQGCSSCPPADAYLHELAKMPDVLALSMHVDYWNGLGWPDPFSSPAVTARQRGYMQALGGRYVYTPQMVVTGGTQAVGSERAAVARLIADARRQGAAGPEMSLEPAEAGKLRVRIGRGTLSGTAAVWLIAFDDIHRTRVAAGENGGRTLAHVNVVRAVRPVGIWSGAAAGIDLDIAEDLEKGYGNWAVLVQVGRYGPILSAATIRATALTR